MYREPFCRLGLTDIFKSLNRALSTTNDDEEVTGSVRPLLQSSLKKDNFPLHPQAVLLL